MIVYGCGDRVDVVDGDTFQSFEDVRWMMGPMFDYVKPRKIVIEECLNCGMWHVTHEGKSQEQTLREEALDALEARNAE